MTINGRRPIVLGGGLVIALTTAALSWAWTTGAQVNDTVHDVGTIEDDIATNVKPAIKANADDIDRLDYQGSSAVQTFLAAQLERDKAMDERHADLLRRLGRIERKLDKP